MTDNTYKKKLIEVAIPLDSISEASATEKTLKNSHPANLHLWWARRPLASARAVLFAQLVDDPSAHPDKFPTEEDQQLERGRLFQILERLIRWEASDDAAILAEARREMTRYRPDLPSILDPFGGGGAIPLESLRLGLRTYTGDLNPVAVLIQRAMLQAVPRFAETRPINPDRPARLGSMPGGGGLAEDLKAYGRQLRQYSETKVGRHYPPVHNGSSTGAIPIAWIWARTVKSPDPAWPGHVPLVKSWILAKKPGKPVIHVVPLVDHLAKAIRFEIREDGAVAEPTVSRGTGVCIATGTPISADYIKAEASAGRMGRVLLAVAAEGNRSRVYAAPSEDQVSAANVPEPAWRPQGRMSDHPQYMGTPRYGLDDWWKLFTARQLLTLTTFVDGIEDVHQTVERDAISAGLADDGIAFADGGSGARAYADVLALLLAFAIDKLADLNNSLAQWEPIAQCPRHLFGRQAIQITWDYAEANPFSSSSGSFDTIVDGIARTLAGRGLALAQGNEASVNQRDAQSQVETYSPIVVSTDPPYYDNVPYADLADFFYVWLRPALSKFLPTDTATLLTPKAEELVADQKRHGSKAKAYEHFEKGMRQVFEHVAKNHHPEFPATIFYAFKAVDENDDARVSSGWASFLGSLIAAGLEVTATWPVRTENKTRLRGQNANALASSIVLACRKRHLSAPMATRGEFIGRLRREMTQSIKVLQKQNIAPVDLAQSSVGPGIAIFSSYAKIVESDGNQMSVASALATINEILSEILSGEASELDAQTRFALTWFEQFGHNPGPFGDADVLAKAKDTSVATVVTSGLAISRDGRLRLLERSELDPNWDPIVDTTLTIWEATQHLIRALEQSETAAAELLRHMGGGVGERARQLAYLLYGICDRKKWADDASAYNMLVTAWPTIERLAAAPDTGGNDADRLF